jgi:large subunit ribosomal protein L18
MANDPNKLRQLRHLRLRQKVKGSANRPRLCVNRSLRHIHAQIIDDEQGRTIAAASTVQGDVAAQVDGGKGSVAAARIIGQVLAERARENGVTQVVFDRNGYKYHGAVKELADAAREGGLEF